MDQGGTQDHCVIAGRTKLDFACKICYFRPDDYFKAKVTLMLESPYRYLSAFLFTLLCYPKREDGRW